MDTIPKCPFPPKVCSLHRPHCLGDSWRLFKHRCWGVGGLLLWVTWVTDAPAGSGRPPYQIPQDGAGPLHILPCFLPAGRPERRSSPGGRARGHLYLLLASWGFQDRRDTQDKTLLLSYSCHWDLSGCLPAFHPYKTQRDAHYCLHLHVVRPSSRTEGSSACPPFSLTREKAEILAGDRQQRKATLDPRPGPGSHCSLSTNQIILPGVI